MPEDRWLVIEFKDGREYEVLESKYQELTPSYWPNASVRGYKDGSKYTAPKPPESEAEVVKAPAHHAAKANA